MHLKFWGTRGSIPKPGPSTVRYGGNTSCIELWSDAGTLVVIDCGTGGHALGQQLMSIGSRELHGHMLISHTHWDHIQGIPFFLPFFVHGTKWDVYGPLGLHQSIRETLAGQMQHTYFPVNITDLGATIRYHSLVEGAFEINEIKVITHYLNHTLLTCGYRLECDDEVVIYSCDHEPYSQIFPTTEAELSEQERKYVEFLSDADLVIHDAQYTMDEYADKIGWGHSPIEYVVKICELAGVKKLALTHYDPLRSDDEVDRILKSIQAKLRKEGSKLEVFAAAEGQEVKVTPAIETLQPHLEEPFAADISAKPALAKQSVLIYALNNKTSAILAEAISADNLDAKFMLNADETIKHALTHKPSLLLIEHDPPHIDGFKICKAIRTAELGSDLLPIVMIAEKEDPKLAEIGITDWLITPFSSSYARSKINAWIMRVACRWIRAPASEDEEKRLAALYKLNILDTEPEERFNRITRQVATLLNVPFALVSLVDKDRQWFKSCHGFSIKETPLDVSFCSHVVNSREIMVVPDTFQDDRFADNPIVVNEPRVRFYAGVPLILQDGSCIGTLCCLDTRPHVLGKKEIKALQELGDLVLKEILTTY